MRRFGVFGGDSRLRRILAQIQGAAIPNILDSKTFLLQGELIYRVKAATAPGARPARRLAALQLVGIERLFRLVVPCQTPRGTHPGGRPTAASRLNCPPPPYGDYNLVRETPNRAVRGLFSVPETRH